MTNEFVGARWPTEGDWTDATIIKIARDTGGGGEKISLGRIAQEQADDRATRAKDLAAADAADAAAFQEWCRVAHATPNAGAGAWTRYMSKTKNKPYWHNAATGLSTWDDPWAFVETPRVALSAEPEAQMRAVAGTYASRPRGRGLGDLISLDPEVRARAVAARTGGGRAYYDALSRAPAWEDSV